MNLGTIFSEKDYGQGLEYATANGYTIKEVNSRQENVKREIEDVDDNGNISIRYETVVEKVRYFQIVEIPVQKLTSEDISNMRRSAYAERTDPLTLRKLRKQALGEWNEEDEKGYVSQIEAISAKISLDFPYNSEA